MVEITDRNSAEAWLETQTHQTQVWLAVRCALRAMPACGVWEDSTKSGVAFATLRSLLVSTAAATCPATEIDRFSEAAVLIVADYSPMDAVDSVAHSAYTGTPITAANAAARGRASRASSVSGPAHAARSAVAAVSAAAATATRGTATPVTVAVDALRGSNSITHFARSAASASAASLDTEHVMRWNALWAPSSQPIALQEGWVALKQQWQVDENDWSFWIEWYEAILNGTPLPWELTQRIALEVTEDEWDAGPGAVAKRVAEIRRDFEAKPLDQDALRSHVQQLAQSSVLHADVAESAGLQIEKAIKAFKDEAPANQLPDGFGAFETLAPTFLSISATLSVPAGTTPDTAALQAEINKLHSTISELRADLQDARLQLSDARLTALEAAQVRTFGEKLQTTLANIMMIGTIGVTTAQFFGVPATELRYEALKAALQGLSSDMENVEPAHEVSNLPEATDV